MDQGKSLKVSISKGSSLSMPINSFLLMIQLYSYLLKLVPSLSLGIASPVCVNKAGSKRILNEVVFYFHCSQEKKRIPSFSGIPLCMEGWQLKVLLKMTDFFPALYALKWPWNLGEQSESFIAWHCILIWAKFITHVWR